MGKNQRRIQKKHVYKGFGFPVVFQNVPLIKVRDIWTPDVDYNKITRLLLIALSQKPKRLTGHEVRFIRHAFKMTLEAFAERFSVSHPAVKKWEDCDNHPTFMSWTTEKDIRLLILENLKVKPVKFVKVYIKLKIAPDLPTSLEPLEIDFKKAA